METSEEWDVEMKLVETRLLLCRSILYQININAEEEDTLNKSIDKVETVDNELPKSEDMNNDFLTDHINLVAMNVCGVKGKEKILQSILNRNDVRVGVLSETWLVGKEKPDMGRGFRSFISNRADKTNRGGVAIVIEKSLAEDSIVIGRNNKGDDLEWLGIRINCFKIPVVIFAVYGCQSSKNSNDESLRKWTELFCKANEYEKKGFHTIIAGDLNAAIGAQLSNNCKSTNNNGKNILKIMNQNPEWQVVNKLNRSDNRTHVDRSSDSSRCLDYFITNKIQCHFRMVVDNDYDFTPYRATDISTDKTKDEKSGRIYSDHKAIMTTFRVNDIRDKVTMKPTIVRNNKGWTNLYQQTYELADKLMEMMDRGGSPAKLFKQAEIGMKKAEFLSFKRMKMNKIKRKMYSDNQAFYALVHEPRAGRMHEKHES